MIARLRWTPPVLAVFLSLFPAAELAAAQVGSTYLRPLKPINATFKSMTIRWHWRSGYGGKTKITYGLEPRGGRVSVCGLHLTIGRHPKQALKRLLSTGRIVSGQTVMMVGLDYFREFKSRDRLLMRCKRTDIPWKTVYGKRSAQLEMSLCKGPICHFVTAAGSP